MARSEALKDASERLEVWVTGIGLVSSLGEGSEAHWRALAGAGPDSPPPRVDGERLAPYPVHPLAEVDLARQIPNKTDMRQMGRWQCLGTYAAGLALADAGLVDRTERGGIHLNVAAGNGERDAAADRAVLEAMAATAPSAGGGDSASILNATLLRVLRPTHYLAELSNLLAGNISIVHGVTASSRTFKGEEMAGVGAVEDAARRIGSGAGDVFLVGGACNGERADLILNLELCGVMWQGAHRSVWERAEDGGGIILGSVGAFLVLESARHALARGKRPYARVTAVASARGDSSGHPGRVAQLRLPDGPPAVLSGASGAEPATARERAWLEGDGGCDVPPSIRGYGTMLGHCLEAQFPAGVGLAAIALSKGQLYRPFDASGFELAHSGRLERVLVTTFGHWRGEGMAMLEAAPGS